MNEHSFCPVYGAIDLLQEKWVLHIIRVLLSGPCGFNELGRAVGGVNTTTLSQRLERLEKAGVISRTVESVMPPRTRYELTEAGHELQGVVDAINAWGVRHMNDPAAEAEATDRLAAA
jgi:DNA-binding HxlR family transcriptional regulator